MTTLLSCTMHDMPLSPLVSLSTDFGPGNKGIGVMKSVILQICPQAQILDLAHDIHGFNVKEGAKLLEAAAWLPVGCHVCVVDPGVGTARRALIIETGRGDRLIGPDNGVLLPVTRFLGGIQSVHDITNERFMRLPVSPTFHGRDVFAPAAAHLASGVPLQEFGQALPAENLCAAAYEEAKAEHGMIRAEAVVINRFGSVFLNVLQEEFHRLFTPGAEVLLDMRGTRVRVPYRKTFGDVPPASAVVLDDDFGRVEVAINQGSFAEKHRVRVGDPVVFRQG